MNTAYFKYAVEVERTRSISRAAKNLNMAQPNLSKAIKEMEESLGFAIFERTPKGVLPTGKGIQFLDYSRNILAQMDSIKALSASSDQNAQKFSVTVSRGSYIATGVVNFVAGLDPQVGLDLDILETSAMEAMNNVISGRYNLGIVRYQAIYEQYYADFLAQRRICSEPIWDFAYLALMSRRHPLAEKEQLQPEDLETYTEIVHGDTVIPFLTAQGGPQGGRPGSDRRQIRLYERCNQFELIDRMPGAFMWASPIPRELLDRYELVQRRCDFPDNRYKDLLIYPNGYRFSSLDQRFIEEISRVRSEVSSQEYR